MRTARAFYCYLLIVPLSGTVRVTSPDPSSVSRLSAPVDSSQQALANQLTQTRQALSSGQFERATALATAGYEAALAAGDQRAAARFLGNRGGAEFLQRHFEAALATYQAAGRIAEKAGDRATAAALSANIAAIYTHFGEVDAAAQWLEKTIPVLSGQDGAAYLPRVQAQLASLRVRQNRTSEAEKLFATAIDQAEERNDLAQVIQYWNRMGEEYLNRGELDNAEVALLEAWRIGKLNRLPVDGPYFNLGKLLLAKGSLTLAGPILDRVVARASEPQGVFLPTWDIYQQRGRLRLAEGRLEEALADLRIAVRLARVWRWAGPNDDAARIGTETVLNRVYSSLIEAANRLYQKSGEPALLAESFSAADENRAASLRGLLADPRHRDAQMPAGFWKAVADLQAAEVDALRRPGTGTEEQLARLRAELVRLEAGAGGSVADQPRNLLASVRSRLDGRTALFAVQLEDQASWLWTIERDGVNLIELPPAEVLTAACDRFVKAVRNDGPELMDAGHDLYLKLLGRAGASALAKEHWILALDGPLRGMPPGALVERPGSPLPYLAQNRVIELVPALSAATPRQGKASFQRSFLGMGDAVYNQADSRAVRKAAPGEDTLALPRLVGTGAELETASAAWGGEAELLQGNQCRRDALLHSMQHGPSVIHIAAHVLQSTRQAGYGMLALSLDENGHPEVVAPYEIARWRTNADLVVLSGCSSAAGNSAAGTGQLGLTRAWLAAGARNVIASQWAVPDDSGPLFQALYRNLRSHPETGAAAALRGAQTEMLEAGGWRARPRYWSAYFVISLGD